MKSTANDNRAQFTYLLILTLLFYLCSIVVSGCVSTRETKEVKTTVTQPADQSNNQAPTTPAPVVVEEEKTTEIKEPSRECVLSSTIHVIGEILALPFRIISGILLAVF